MKFFYNRLPRILKMPFVIGVMAVTKILVIVKYTLKFKPMTAIAPLFRDRQERDMIAKYDEIDWIGRFSYEFASLETLTAYFKARGFSLLNAKRNANLGYSEMVLQRSACAE